MNGVEVVMGNMVHYQRCEISGYGELFAESGHQGAPFKVLDISASGIRIATQHEMEVHDLVTLNIQLEGHLVEFSHKAKGKVAYRMTCGEQIEYRIRFIGLSHKVIVEIDEFLRFNCGLGSMHYISSPKAHSSDQ
jgi:hypothetical protein